MRITVYVAFPKQDKLEHIVQKATELGAAEIAVFPSERCVSRPDGKALKTKLPRWEKIAASAAEQSGRGRIPRVRTLPNWQAVLDEAKACDLPLFFYELEAENALHRLLLGRQWRSAAIITGPEGGFSEREAAQAVQAGLLSASLGTRILRCETAPLAALSALLFAANEM